MPNSQNPASPDHLAANRANAAKSTGPRTSQRKTRSAQNARKHGFTASTFAVIRLPGRYSSRPLESLDSSRSAPARWGGPPGLPSWRCLSGRWAGPDMRPRVGARPRPLLRPPYAATRFAPRIAGDGVDAVASP
jgi:hypothetical protein